MRKLDVENDEANAASQTIIIWKIYDCVINKEGKKHRIFIKTRNKRETLSVSYIFLWIGDFFVSWEEKKSKVKWVQMKIKDKKCNWVGVRWGGYFMGD
jgi:hypothetical protein